MKLFKNLHFFSKHLSIFVILFIAVVSIVIVSTPSSSIHILAQQDVNKTITPSLYPSQFVVPSTTSGPTPVVKYKPKQDSKFADIALEKVSKKQNISKDKLKVANAKDAVFPFSGKKSHDVRLIDENGNLYDSSLDDSGNEVDYNALVTEDRETKIAKYGKFNPDFYNKLAESNTGKQETALITIRRPVIAPLPRPIVRFPENATDVPLRQLEEINQKEAELYNNKFQPILNSAIAKFKSMGYDFSTNSDGFFVAEMSFKELKEIEKWDEVQAISDGTARLKDLLASARAASGITAVNNRSMTEAE